MGSHMTIESTAQVEGLQVTAANEARLLKAYEMVGYHYRQDMAMFWTRANLFLLVQTGFLGIQAALVSRDDSWSLFIAAVGFAVSIIWLGVARSSALWIAAWRDRMI